MTSLEIIISVAVVALVVFAAWRVGQQNPVGTGRLARRMSELEAQVRDIDGRMDGIEQAVSKLAESGAATNVALEAIRVELAADRGLTERTWFALDRLQNYFIEQSFKRGDIK